MYRSGLLATTFTENRGVFQIFHAILKMLSPAIHTFLPGS